MVNDPDVISRGFLYHGSARGIGVLGLDIPHNDSRYGKRGVCFVGLGEKENSKVYFTKRFNKAVSYSQGGSDLVVKLDPRGNPIFGIDSETANLREEDGSYISDGRVPKEQIRQLFLPTYWSSSPRRELKRIAVQAMKLLPNSEAFLFDSDGFDRFTFERVRRSFF